MNSILLLIICFKLTFGWVEDRTDKTIEIESFESRWGDWSEWRYCDSGHYMIGIRVSYETWQGDGDDTGANIISMHCDNDEWVSPSKTSPWGNKDVEANCDDGETVLGYKTIVESSQGGSSDDTALNNVEIYCSNDDTATPDKDSWGDWAKYHSFCDSGDAVCGFRVKVESDQGGSGDDTAVNGVDLYCCTGGGYAVTPLDNDGVIKYAPTLRFDGKAEGYPMNIQTYLDDGCGPDLEKCQNDELDESSNPTYYRILRSTYNGNYDIVYWWFYGYQEECMTGQGAHDGDWERIYIHIKNNEIESVTFFQHSGYYTTSDFHKDDDNHPIIFVGKIAHGSYFDGRDGVGGGCGYFYDFRNPGDSDLLNTWNNLINLDESDDEWIKNNQHVSGSNPLDDKNSNNIYYGCDDCGCWYEDCDDDWDLIITIPQCIGTGCD